MLPIQTILHPTDFSQHADNAYRVARLIARECGARLIVLHVAGMHVDASPAVSTEMGVPFILPGDYRSYHAALQGQLHERYDPTGDYLRDHASLNGKLRERYETDRTIRVETRLEEGYAAVEILRVAEEVRCDLIVMGTHGRSGLGRLLMGSVAETVMRKARCPVLTVKVPIPVPAPAPIVPAMPGQGGAAHVTMPDRPTDVSVSRALSARAERAEFLRTIIPIPENPSMLADQSRVIVEDSLCACCAVPTKRVHHRDFPEIRAECGSVAEGVAHLAGQLSRAREGVGSEWHREAIERAMADVAAFLDTLAEAGQEGEASCQCDVRVPGPLESSLAGRCPSR